MDLQSWNSFTFPRAEILLKDDLQRVVFKLKEEKSSVLWLLGSYLWSLCVDARGGETGMCHLFVSRCWKEQPHYFLFLWCLVDTKLVSNKILEQSCSCSSLKMWQPNCLKKKETKWQQEKIWNNYRKESMDYTLNLYDPAEVPASPKAFMQYEENRRKETGARYAV